MNNRLIDARNKIIMKKRNTLRDARDRLCELARNTDARIRINNNTKKNKNNITRRISNKHYNNTFHDITRQVQSVPLNIPVITPKPIVRSINNDLIYNNKIKRGRTSTYTPDLNLKIVANNTISRSRPVSILKKKNNSNNNNKQGYRILVSNLQSSVTAADIHELFGDVGHLLESKLVRPGTAEVIYSSIKDANKAVDIYHNRQLDGQPMNCFLVNPKNNHHIDTSYLPASSNSSVIPDVSTVHKVLFGIK